MPDPSSLDAAILRTVLYADVFDFALTVPELHHFLMHSACVSETDVRRALAESVALRSTLAWCDEMVALAGREALFDLRRRREEMAQALWPHARRYARALACLPFVHMVALTGALAMRNPATPRDDFDYLIVTQPGRVWLARLMAVALVRAVRLRGWEICPNFVLAEDALLQARRDLYIAHEVAQAVPFYGKPVYDRLRQANDWTVGYLPNAKDVYHGEPMPPLVRVSRWTKGALEWLLGGRLGDRIEAWERQRKMRRFQAAQTSQSAARVDGTQVKGHFNDHGGGVMEQYQRRLAAHGLSDAQAEIAAD